MHLVNDMDDTTQILEHQFLNACRSMSEVEMHSKVVQPFLEQLGMQHVTYCHGPSERGKDFYFCAENNYGDIELHVCSVKNSKFNARAGDSSSVYTALSQLEQCLNTRLLNPQTQGHDLPRSALFISTYQLPDRGLENLDDMLERLSSRTTYLTAEKFAKLVRTRTPKLFYQIVDPDAELNSFLASSVDTYSETAAFGLDRSHACSDVFIHLSACPSRSIVLQQLQEGKVLCDVTAAYLPRSRVDELADTSSALEKTLKTNPLIERSGGDNETIGAVEANKTRVKRIALGAAINSISFDCDRDPTERAEHFAAVLAYLDVLEQCYELVGGVAFKSDGENANKLISRLTIEQDGAELLYSSGLCLLIEGNPGAGKTFTAREICRRAFAQRISCIYFPCSRIVNECSLGQAIVDYVCQSASAMTKAQAERTIATAKLIVLDGCDEAATIDTRLGSDIAKLSYPKPLAVSLGEDYQQIRAYLDKLLPDRFRLVRVKASGKRSLVLADRLTHAECALLKSVAGESGYANVLNEIIAAHSLLPRVIATSRKANDLELTASFYRVSLLPLNDAQLDLFLKRWERASKTDFTPLTEFLAENKHVKEVCRSPMTATILVAIFLSGASLPNSRSELYANRFELLLGDWDRIRGVSRKNQVSKTTKLRFLSRLALQLHRRRESNCTAIEASKLWQSDFRHLFPHVSADDLIDELVVKNGVLERRSEELSFGHLSFQEYLSAVAIVYSQDYKTLARNLSNPWWYNVSLFYAGITGDPEKLLSTAQQTYGLHNRHNMLNELLDEAKYSGPVADLIREVVEESEDYSDYIDDEGNESD